jgi:glycine/D-amino acid oxidase-like deaminating enzyme
MLGASIAYHLARRGARVTVLEKERPAAGTTSKSFAWINATFSKEPRAYFDLNMQGIAHWHRWEEELAGELKVDWSGSVEWHPPGEAAETLRRLARRHQEWGHASTASEGTAAVDELAGRLPEVEPGEVQIAAYSSQEGAVDAVRAVEVLLHHARRHGAEVAYPSQVTALRLESGQVGGVITTHGELDCDVLVVACGVGTPAVAAMAGVTVPLKDAPGVLIHTTPLPPLTGPVTLAPGAHFRQYADGRVVAGVDFGGSEVPDATFDYGTELLARAAEYLPALPAASLATVSRGQRVMPLDEYPIVGFAAACPNLYVAAMHSGVTLAALMGHSAAAEILEGVRFDYLEPYRLERFS